MLSRLASVAEMVRRTVAELGGLDILVSNAGILKAHDIQEFPLDDWKRVLDVNLTGYFLCAREAGRVMAAQKRGAIIQINSKSGKKGSFRNSAYAASKFGGIGLTQSLALDLAPYGVRVNAVCPGNLLDGSLWQQIPDNEFNRTAVQAFLYIITDMRAGTIFGVDEKTAKEYEANAKQAEERLLAQEPLGVDIRIDNGKRVFVYDGDTGEGGYVD